MFKKSLDVVKTIGNSIKETVIEGEYLGKGGLVAAGTMIAAPAFAAVDAAVTLPLASTCKAKKKCWAYGSHRLKVLNSGWALSLNLRTVVYKTFSSPVWMV